MTNDSARTATTSDHRIVLPDGRAIALSEAGDPSGPAVLLLHPGPGSRLLDPDPVVTAGAGVRLIGIDRAGYGRSTALPDGAVPTITGYADDMAAGLATLGIRDAGVVGWSAGGRVALAIAARHPELVRSVAIVGTPAPHEDVPWISEEHMDMVAQLAADPGRAATALATVFGDMAAAPPAAAVELVASGPDDEAALAAAPARRRRLEAMLAEAFAQGALGMAADIVSYTLAPWGFDPAAVGARTTAFYGEGDVMIPPAHGEWYAARVPGAALRSVPRAGHLVALTAWADIVAAVA